MQTLIATHCRYLGIESAVSTCPCRTCVRRELECPEIKGAISSDSAPTVGLESQPAKLRPEQQLQPTRNAVGNVDDG